MSELVLPSVISTYFVALILLYFGAHFFGIGRELHLNESRI